MNHFRFQQIICFPSAKFKIIEPSSVDASNYIVSHADTIKTVGLPDAEMKRIHSFGLYLAHFPKLTS
jgi:hypothetical protein